MPNILSVEDIITSTSMDDMITSVSAQEIGKSIGKIVDSFVQNDQSLTVCDMFEIADVFLKASAFIDEINNGKKPAISSTVVSTVTQPEEWRETLWRRIQKRIFPSYYHADLEYNARMWDRYIAYVEEEGILPEPIRPSHLGETHSTGPC